MKRFIVLFCLIPITQQVAGQLICGDSYTDSGGSTAQYSDDESDTIVICPDIPGNIVELVFSSFDLEPGFDYMYIYSGNSATGTPVGTYTGTSGPGIIDSEDPTGCLTVVFTSDLSVTHDGWVAFVNCIPAPSCLRPSSLLASNMTDADVDLSWNPGGSETGWIIEYGPNGFIPGTGTSSLSSSNPFTLTGLNQLTSYQVYIRAICSPGDTSSYSGPVNFTTNAAALTCGDGFTDSGGSLNSYSDNESYTVSACPSAPGELAELIFSSFDLEDGFDFMTIYDGPDVNSTLIDFYTGTTSPGTIISSDPSGCLTISFSSDISVSYPGWIAQVNCIPAPTCLKPTSLAVSNQTDVSVNLSWTANSSESSWIIEYGSPGFQNGNGTSIVVNSNPFTLGGLNSMAVYEFYVKAFCGGTDTSYYSLPVQGMTTFAPFTCGNLFTDQGGVSNNYNANTNDTITICPDNSLDTLRISFIGFATELNVDVLTAYNGNSTSSPLIGNYSGTGSPGVITASNASGCLTFVFNSGNTIQDAGWIAQIDCIPFINGISEAEENGIRFYPNPTQGILYLENKRSENYRLDLLDLNGRKMALPLSTLTSLSSEILDLNYLESGIYFLRVSNRDRVITHCINLIKQ